MNHHHARFPESSDLQQYGITCNDSGQEYICIVGDDQVSSYTRLKAALASGAGTIVCHVQSHLCVSWVLETDNRWAESLRLVIVLEHNAKFSLTLFHRDGSCKTVHIESHLVGEGALLTLQLLAALGQGAHFTCVTSQRHHAPLSTSSINFKAIVGPDSTSVYAGTITIEKNAQGSRAKQLNKNMLLSETSNARSMPALEALTDDVSCAHGTATGPLDQEHVWFLTTRGLSADQSRRMLLRSFIQEGIEDAVSCLHTIGSDVEPCVSHCIERLIAHCQGIE